MGSRKVDRNHLRICCWLFCTVLVLGSLGVVAWLSLIPKNPTFQLSSVIPPPDSSNNSTNRNTTVLENSLLINLDIHNPNKRMGIYYNGITLQLYKGGGGLVGANSSTPAFYQGYKNTSSIQVEVRANREFWQGVRGRTVDFVVQVETEVRFRIIRWTTKLKHVEYEAHLDNVKISLNGTVSGANYTEVHNSPSMKLRN